MTLLVLAALVGFVYSPSDSSWKLVTLSDVPERALLFAELAAREGGRTVIDFGSLLELSGEFQQAASVFSIALESADDPLLKNWIEQRISGSRPLDTLLVLTTRITNPGSAMIEDIEVRIPLPVPHPPYQSLRTVAGPFRSHGGEMTAVIRELEPGSTMVLPMVLRIDQEPYTFRPLVLEGEGTPEADILAEIARAARSIRIPEDVQGPGPCLGLAMALRDSLAERGFDAGVTGGLLRTPGDTLVFHAWNLLLPDSVPVDVSLFQADSLRGLAHCPTDIIPLWDLESTDGHEVSAYFAEPDGELSISMEARFLDHRIGQLFDGFPLSLTRFRE